MITEFNPVHQEQAATNPCVLGASRKENAACGQGQPVTFACIMGGCVSGMATQKTEKDPLPVHSDKGKTEEVSDNGHTIGRDTASAEDSVNHILSAEKDTTGKTDQSLPVMKGMVFVENVAETAREGETSEDVKGVVANGGRDFLPLSENASKDAGAKTNESIIDKNTMLPESNSRKQIEGTVERVFQGVGSQNNGLGKYNTPEEDVAVQAKQRLNGQGVESGVPKQGVTGVVTGKEEAPVKGTGSAGADHVEKAVMTERAAISLSGEESLRRSGLGIYHTPEEDVAVQAKQGLNGQGVESGVPKQGVAKPGVTGVVAGKEEAPVNGTGSAGADHVEKAVMTEGVAIPASRKGGLTESGEGRNSHLKELAPGALKLGLKQAGGETKGNGIGSRNNSAELSGHSALKGGETGVDYERTGIEKLSDQNADLFPRTNSLQLHSIDKVSSAGSYHHASLYSESGSEIVNETVSSRGIDPQALINQVASGVQKSGRIRITLNPPRLGVLDVNVLVRDNKVQVMLLPENSDVGQILQSNVESLKSSLRGQGLIADNVNVSVHEQSDTTDYGSGRNETLFKESGNREGNKENREDRHDFSQCDSTSLEEENQRVRGDESVNLFV